MKIELKTMDGCLFAQTTSWEAANFAASRIWRRNIYSDLSYTIEVDGQVWQGCIDLEPHSFHAPHHKQLLTWHIQTFYSNVLALDEEKRRFWGLNEDKIKEIKALLSIVPNVIIKKAGKYYEVWNIALNQRFANEFFKSHEEAIQFINQNNLILYIS